jgi:hypothetical protein
VGLPPQNGRRNINKARKAWKNKAVNRPIIKGIIRYYTEWHQKTGTFENPTKLKHFYGESTLLTVPLIHDY